MELTGIHHVSALTAQAAQNVDFYTRVLGMRLVKKTVNQDNTASYHLFYGDKLGNPGTELTFFDIPQAARNLPGVSSISRVALRVPDQAALTFWQERLRTFGVEQEPLTTHAGRTVLPFQDFEGQRLLLVDESGDPEKVAGTAWERAPVPVEVAIRGLGPVTLTVRDAQATARMLTELLGFRQVGHYAAPVTTQPNIAVYATGPGGAGAEMHVAERHDLGPERLGRGGVHHVALRVPTAEEHTQWLARLEEAGVRTSGLIDRFYFRSIYFRDPNGILFELATDGPGFAVDEAAATLGERLALPPFLEPQRQQIEAKLRPLETSDL